MTVTALTALVRKDLLVFFTDRRAVILTLAIPIAIASFFGSLFSGPSESGERARVAVAVVDQDGSGLSKRLLTTIAADRALAVTQPPLDEARAGVQAGRLAVAVVIPAGFGATATRAFLTQGTSAELQLLTDPSRSAESSMVRGILTGHVMQAVVQESFTGAQGRQLMDESLKTLESSGMPADQRDLLRQLLQSAQGLSRAQETSGTPAPALATPFEVRETPVTGNPLMKYNGYAHSFAGMGIQFALFAAIDLAAGILLERERGLWKRLRSAPLSRTTLLVARGISGTVITMLTLLTGFVFAVVVFRVSIGNVAGFVAMIVASSVMAAAFGLLVAALGRTVAATRRAAAFVVLVMVMLGGAWVPAFLFPAWLQQFTWLVPVRWSVEGLDAVTWRGLGFADVLVPIGLLLGFSVLCGVLALWRFRWEEA
jgi:ABC-2 type transport system permease protein